MYKALNGSKKTVSALVKINDRFGVAQKYTGTSSLKSTYL